jgi:hypothetical protein
MNGLTEEGLDMIAEPSRLEWSGISLSIAAVVVVASITIASVVRTADVEADRQVVSVPPEERTLPMRLAAIDHAIARKDAGRAIHAWRDAYGVALRSRRWEAMADVGDAALRIDAIAALPSGTPTAFRAEARQAYLKALFDARAAGSAEGVERIAAAFAALGDAEMAAQARKLKPR